MNLSNMELRRGHCGESLLVESHGRRVRVRPRPGGARLQPVGSPTPVAQDRGGVGGGVVVEPGLGHTHAGHATGGRQSGQAGQAVPHVVHVLGVTGQGGGQELRGWGQPHHLGGNAEESENPGVDLVLVLWVDFVLVLCIIVL